MAPKLAASGNHGDNAVVRNDVRDDVRSDGMKVEARVSDVDNSIWNELYKISAVFSPVSGLTNKNFIM